MMIKELTLSEAMQVWGAQTCKWQQYDENIEKYLLSGVTGFIAGASSFASVFSAIGGRYDEHKRAYWGAMLFFGALQGAVVGVSAGCKPDI